MPPLPACVFCGRHPCDIHALIREWPAFYYDPSTGETEAGPVCEECAAERLEFDEEGARLRMSTTTRENDRR